MRAAAEGAAEDIVFGGAVGGISKPAVEVGCLVVESLAEMTVLVGYFADVFVALG